MSKEDSNPIICHIGKFEIRQSNKITVTLNSNEYSKLVTAHINSDCAISIPKLIALQGQACQKCGNNEFSLIIPKSILSIKKGSNGGNITTRNHGK